MYTKAFEDQSDNDSETSSVCSERSFDSSRRNDVSDPVSLDSTANAYLQFQIVW